MEKKKLLLVAISVGIFLVIAIGAAIVFAPKNASAPFGTTAGRAGERNITVSPPPSYLPSLSDLNASTPENTGSSQLVSVDAIDLVRKPGDVPGLKSPPEGTTRPSSDFYVNGATQSGPGRSSETVISVPKPSTAAVPDTPPAGKTVSSQPSRPAAPAAPKPEAQTKPVAQTKPAAQPKPVVQTKAQSSPAVQPRIYDDYWVQTGAFSTIAKAEGVKETLALKGIKSIIENRDMDGTILFRVRVGPYTSQNEADYWLSLIKTMGGFEDSQVRISQSRR